MAYTNYLSVVATHDFNIDVQESLCNSQATVTPNLDLADTSNIQYEVRGTQISIGKITFTPAYCVLTT